MHLPLPRGPGQSFLARLGQARFQGLHVLHDSRLPRFGHYCKFGLLRRDHRLGRRNRCGHGGRSRSRSRSRSWRGGCFLWREGGVHPRFICGRPSSCSGGNLLGRCRLFLLLCGSLGGFLLRDSSFSGSTAFGRCGLFLVATSVRSEDAVDGGEGYCSSGSHELRGKPRCMQVHREHSEQRFVSTCGVATERPERGRWSDEASGEGEAGGQAGPTATEFGSPSAALSIVVEIAGGR